ncbi:AbiH family protein [Streptococcus sp.]|uniref:AbiH family protein n=1 Tax=Streptococcus sp. TaxID=1306 RepID=UPI0026DB9D87|nr:AbiH family protein [Streptococcus sp.]MDO4886758.1 AbiH family protein [Streptococcus sp.]
MVENILILGNGFDLAMGRKTSYGDFLRFLNSISVQSSNSEEFFDTNIIDGLIQEKKIEKDDYFSKISKNLFLNYIYENKKKLGKKWSSIELVISDIAEAIAFFKKNGIKNAYIENESNYTALIYIKKYLDVFVPGYLQLLAIIGSQEVMDKCNEKCIQALNDLTDYLEFYLTYLDKLDFDSDSDSEQRIVKQDSSLDAIEGLQNAKVLTFNYTDTANRLFGISEENTHFIHGRIDFARDKKSINTMVFGIEDKEDKTENINPDLISYQKFYQRIIKETGSDYRKFFEKPKDSGKSVDDMNIIVFGHSVDPLDKEIFEKCFELAEERGGKYKFIFNYYDEKAKREIVKNLTIILEKERMISLTAEQKVAFVKCDDVQRMKRELL